MLILNFTGTKNDVLKLDKNKFCPESENSDPKVGLRCSSLFLGQSSHSHLNRKLHKISPC